jgi:multicomponent Na+:H+ antiporter subunit F
MQELVQQNAWIFTVILIVLAIMLIAFLIRAIIGPRIADRLVAVNMITTMVMAIVSILAIVMDEGYLVDICLIYAMISFLAVVVLSKVYTGVYFENKEKQKRLQEAKLEKGEMTDGNS